MEYTRGYEIRSTGARTVINYSPRTRVLRLRGYGRPYLLSLVFFIAVANTPTDGRKYRVIIIRRVDNESRSGRPRRNTVMRRRRRRRQYNICAADRFGSVNAGHKYTRITYARRRRRRRPDRTGRRTAAAAAVELGAD